MPASKSPKPFTTRVTNVIKDPRRIQQFITDKVNHRRSLVREQLEMMQPKQSHSQSGEDLLMQYLCKAIKLTKPTYMDIGAHHPLYLNNTAIFYQAGSRGINIEPDVSLYEPFTKQRSEDTNLNIGVAPKAGELKFYVMNHPVLNTFSKSEVKKYLERGYKVIEERTIPVLTIADVIKKYHKNKFPDILTMDVEGLDFKLIKSIDYKKSAPTIICVETTTPYEKTYRKVPEIINYLLKKGYMVYADTYINTIFVKADRWEKLY